jgi:hypothetical protein
MPLWACTENKSRNKLVLKRPRFLLQGVVEYQKMKKGPTRPEDQDEEEDGEWCGMKRARDEDDEEQAAGGKDSASKQDAKGLSRGKKAFHKPKIAAAKKSKLAATKKKGGGGKKKK